MIRVQELSELYNAYAGIYDKKNLSEEEGALTTCKDGKKRVDCAAADAIYDKKQKENKGTVTKYKDGKPIETKEIDVNKKSNSEVDKFSSISKDDFDKKYGDGNGSTNGSSDGSSDGSRKEKIKNLEDKITKAENDRKNKNEQERLDNISKGETKTEVKPEDKTEVKPENKTEVKPEDKTEVKPENKTEVKPEDKKTEVKQKRMNPIERRNREIHGDKKVDFLKQKQKDFKTMQALSQLPDAKPGEQKAIFAKKYPNSNVAKDLRASKRTTQWYDLESYDAFDIVLNHLMETNQVDSIDEALYVMVEMDQNIIGEIVKEFNG